MRLEGRWLMSTVLVAVLGGVAILQAEEDALTIDSEVVSMAVSPDGNWVFAGSAEERGAVFYVGDPAAAVAPPEDYRSQPMQFTTSDPTCVAFSADSRWLGVANGRYSEGSEIAQYRRIYPYGAAKTVPPPPPEVLETAVEHEVASVATGRSGAELCIATTYGIRFFDASSGKTARQDVPMDTRRALLSGSGRRMVTEDRGRVSVRGASTSKPSLLLLEEASRHWSGARSDGSDASNYQSLSLCGVSSDGSVVVVVHEAGRKSDDDARAKSYIEAFDAATAESLWSQRAGERPRRGDVVCAGSTVAYRRGNTITLRDARTGESIRRIVRPGATAMASADGVTWWVGDKHGRVTRD